MSTEVSELFNLFFFAEKDGTQYFMDYSGYKNPSILGETSNIENSDP
jgi:hypothetical protein